MALIGNPVGMFCQRSALRKHRVVKNILIGAHVYHTLDHPAVALQIRYAVHPELICAGIDARRGALQAVVAQRSIHELRIVCDVPGATGHAASA